MNLSLSRFAKYSWAVLAYNVFVILFGAFVRATGSGAGCGAHWPLCNGVVIPQPKQIATVIEFTHRLTSGLTLILVVILVVWAWRKYAKGSLMRWSSAAAIFFTITEALVGASLVLYGWVATNTSAARAVSVPVHLVNTFLLLAAITITAWWATVGVPEKLRLHGLTGVLIIIGGLAILLLGASGAITALGDTLFPSSSLAEGMAQDFSPTAHFLIRMRIYHPGIAVSAGIYLLLVTLFVRRRMDSPRIEIITNALFGLYVLQILLGIINIALLAPVWMQIVHLLVSNLVWISYVLMGTVVFSSLLPSVGYHHVNDFVEALPGKYPGK
jgi:heme A synthase